MATAKKVAVVGATADDTARIQQLIEQHRHELDPQWKTSMESAADFLVVDIDSIYGHMDWLKIQSSGRAAAVFTDAPHSKEATLILRKPLQAANLISLLNQAALTLRAPAAQPVSVAPPAPAPVATVKPVQLPPKPSVVPPAPAPAPRNAPDAAAAVPVAPTVTATAPPRPRRLVDFLEGEVLTGPVRLAAEGLPSLILDPSTRSYHAPQGLKSLGGWCTRPLERADFAAVDLVELNDARSAFPEQPWSRLRWLASLLGGAGQLDPELDPTARYQLARWPQSEREFPRHFRIATAMMKTAATAEDIAEQSGTPLQDVVDFINAYHSTGFIHMEGGTAEESAQREQGRGNNLLSRLRKPFGN